MSELNDPTDGDYEVANSDLLRGLKTCRSVVNNYRRLLSSNDNPVVGQSAEAAGDPTGDMPIER